MKKVFVIRDRDIRARAIDYISRCPEGEWVTVGPEIRSLAQNAALWPLLECFAQQLEWPVNGRMVKLAREDWKDILTAAFRQETPRIAASLNIDGPGVMLGMRTSKMGKREFGEFLEFVHAVAAERGVDLSGARDGQASEMLVEDT